MLEDNVVVAQRDRATVNRSNLIGSFMYRPVCKIIVNLQIVSDSLVD